MYEARALRRDEETYPSKEERDLLIEALSEDLGFSAGQPIAACLIYKCLQRWKPSEVEKTDVFNRILDIIKRQIQAQHNNDLGLIKENNELLAYWLSNVSTLLLLLQEKQKASTPAPMDFQQRLTAILEKIFVAIRQNMKAGISQFVSIYSQVPGKSYASVTQGSHSHVNTVAKQSTAHPRSSKDYEDTLTRYFQILIANHVPPLLIRELFTQIFASINFQLFNNLFSNWQCCSRIYGEYALAGIIELKQWCSAYDELGLAAWKELEHFRQAVEFLVHEKSSLTPQDITNKLCPALSIQQVLQLNAAYVNNKTGTPSVSPRVVEELGARSGEKGLFLLTHDKSCSKFKVGDDYSKLTREINVRDVDLSPVVTKHPGFTFLLQR